VKVGKNQIAQTVPPESLEDIIETEFSLFQQKKRHKPLSFKSSSKQKSISEESVDHAFSNISE